MNTHNSQRMDATVAKAHIFMLHTAKRGAEKEYEV
jgi:hypothetical protein